MTLRGTFRDGVIVPESSDALRNGDVVEITRAVPERPKRPKAVSQAKASPGFGAWKHRSDIADAAGAARLIRRRTSRGTA